MAALLGAAGAIAGLAMGCPRPSGVVSATEQQEAGLVLAEYRRWALAPARVPPPQVEDRAIGVEDGAVVGSARLIRSEDAPWNRWVDGSPRLFNERAALFVELSIDGPGPLAWVPGGTTLEINDERTTLGAAASPEVLLGELLYHAFLEERWAVGGDLVARTRSAGAFRAAWMPETTAGTSLSGIVGFPLVGPDGPLPELQVVALRLTVPVLAGDGAHRLVFVLE